MLCKSDCVSVFFFLNFPRGAWPKDKEIFLRISLRCPVWILKPEPPFSQPQFRRSKAASPETLLGQEMVDFLFLGNLAQRWEGFGGREAAVLTAQNQNLNWERPARSWDPALRSVGTGDAAFSFNTSKSGRIGKPKGLPRSPRLGPNVGDFLSISLLCPQWGQKKTAEGPTVVRKTVTKASKIVYYSDSLKGKVMSRSVPDGICTVLFLCFSGVAKHSSNSSKVFLPCTKNARVRNVLLEGGGVSSSNSPLATWIMTKEQQFASDYIPPATCITPFPSWSPT